MTTSYPFTIGDFECTVFQDGITSMPIERFWGQGHEAERQQVYEAQGINTKAVELSTNILLLERNGQRILIGTGTHAYRPEQAQLFVELAKADIHPDSIDVVAITHAHPDHYGGMLDSDGKKRFPNAEYVMWQHEWKYYTSDEQLTNALSRGQERHDFIQHYLGGLAPHLRLINETDDVVAEGIRAIPAYGHSRYHVRYEIESQTQRLQVIGDAIVPPLHLNYPHWHLTFDFDDEQAIKTRYNLRDSLADELILAYHFPFPGLGYIRHEQDQYLWQTREANE